MTISVVCRTPESAEGLLSEQTENTYMWCDITDMSYVDNGCEGMSSHMTQTICHQQFWCPCSHSSLWFTDQKEMIKTHRGYNRNAFFFGLDKTNVHIFSIDLYAFDKSTNSYIYMQQKGEHLWTCLIVSVTDCSISTSVTLHSDNRFSPLSCHI